MSLDNGELENRIAKLVAHLNEADFEIYAFMNLAVHEVLELTPATGVVVELVEGDEMVYRAATGVMEPYLGLRLPIKGSISGLCVETREALCSEDTEKDTRVNLPACQKIGARSLVVAPLFHLRKAVGVLKIVSDKPDNFSPQDIEILKKVAACLGNALAAQIYQDIRKFI